MNIVIDTSAWIEYFLGTSFGKHVTGYLEQGNLITPSLVLLELSYRADRENWNFENLFSFIKMKSRIIGIGEQLILNFGPIYNNAKKSQKDFSFVDAVILATAQQEQAHILTKDFHFKNFKDVILLK